MMVFVEPANCFSFCVGVPDQLKVSHLDIVMGSSSNTATMMVAVSAPTWVVTLLGALPSRTCFCGTSITPLNQLAWIVHHKMVPLKSTTINLSSAPATRTLLYGSGLPAKFWSTALLHSVYLHNRLVHAKETKVTPFEGYFGTKPDLSNLKVFGSQVCIKRSGDRSGKLDRNDFTGIFVGFTATDYNISYLHLDSGIVKHSHYAIFDEAWYLQPNRPPAAQLLYDLGLEIDTKEDPVESVPTPSVPWPLLPTYNPQCRKFLDMPLPCLTTLLHLRETLAAYQPMMAAAAWTFVLNEIQHDNPAITARVHSTSPSNIVAEYLIGKHDMATVYMSPDPYFEAFEETIDLQKFNLHRHCTAGLCLAQSNDSLFLGGMAPSTPGSKIPHWRSQLKGAWLIKVCNNPVSSIMDVQTTFATAIASGFTFIPLLFSHPEIQHNISHDGLPIVSSAPFSQHVHDQMNKCWDFTTVANYLRKAPPYQVVEDGGVLNYVTRVMKLTRGKLLQQDNWTDRQTSEFLQLD